MSLNIDFDRIDCTDCVHGSYRLVRVVKRNQGTSANTNVYSFVPATSAIIGQTDKIMTRIQTQETVSKVLFYTSPCQEISCINYTMFILLESKRFCSRFTPDCEGNKICYPFLFSDHRRVWKRNFSTR